MKWSKINIKLLTSNQQLVIKDTDNNPDHIEAVKSVLGLDTSSVINGFEFEVSVFGSLSKCSLAAQMHTDRGQLKTIVESGKAEEASLALANEAYSEDLLNLFDKEDEAAPTLSMLVDFVRSHVAGFQDIPSETSKLWITQFSDVNSWAFYWCEDCRLNCLAKMSG